MREKACATTHQVIASSYSSGGQLLMGKSGEVCQFRTPLWTNLNDFIVGMADSSHLCSTPDVFK